MSRCRPATGPSAASDRPESVPAWMDLSGLCHTRPRTTHRRGPRGYAGDAELCRSKLNRFIASAISCIPSSIPEAFDRRSCDRAPPARTHPRTEISSAASSDAEIRLHHRRNRNEARGRPVRERASPPSPASSTSPGLSQARSARPRRSSPASRRQRQYVTLRSGATSRPIAVRLADDEVVMKERRHQPRNASR